MYSCESNTIKTDLFHEKVKQSCWSCSFTIWTENNWNMLSRKFQFSYRYLQVVADCWDGQQVGNPSHEQQLKKKIRPELKHQELHTVVGGGGKPYAIEDRYCTVFVLLQFLEKSDFRNCAGVKPSWCIKSISDKAELKTFLLNSLYALCLSSAVCVSTICSQLRLSDADRWCHGSLDSQYEGTRGWCFRSLLKQRQRNLHIKIFFPDTLSVLHSNGIFLTYSV